MYGPAIEKEFHHVTFENEQRRRTLETRRLLEAERQHQERPRRSLVDIFGRIVPRLDLRTPAGRSPIAQS
jgi:hypothetical protein